MTIYKNIALLFYIMSSTVYAGSQTGKVSTLYARASDNLHLVMLTGGTDKVDSPSCATKGYWLIRDENSVAGKSQFSQLLAAKMAGKTVTISGLNSCIRWFDGEDINKIVIKD
ncbi:hypothetical protein F7Q91_13600 [Vibrio chagasii]|uniref:Uncharacterized protein n=1 Tax=Vibrio chagasii TaxID=170679 RepID=A0A7V7NTB8_9VIBR|nr:hypothetical protein [Vibrio chagasii]KAB0479306.1 hypothetical protein F7Q91_13600 [Vibrio chagasii]